MATETTAPTTAPAPPAHHLAQVRVPTRSWAGELRAIRVVWRRELIRFSRDRLRIVTSLVQPFLFLFVLGTGLSSLVSASTDGVNFKTFIYPGVLCMAVMFTAMFSAASIVWDREFGFLREMMVAPVRRSSIVLGKCFGGATVAAFQGLIVIAIAGLVGCPLQHRAPAGDLRAAAAARLLDHRLRHDGRRAHHPDAVLHGAHADGDHADVLHLRRHVLRRAPAPVAGDPQPHRPAHLRRRPDAPRDLRPPRPSAPPHAAHWLPGSPGGAGTCPSIARGRRHRRARTRDAGQSRSGSSAAPSSVA